MHFDSNKNYRKLISLLTVLILIILSSCEPKRKEPMLQEKGMVVEKQYVPDTRDVITGTGISTNGSVVFTTHNVGEAEKFMVIFKCEHQTVFAVNKKDIYGKVNKGDSVIIYYYELVDKEGMVIEYEFVNANVLNKK